MLKPDAFKSIKQTNVSKNPEKTMERLKAVWRTTEKTKREEILALCGLNKASIERAYKTGNVSAKIIAAVAQIAELDPLYLVGDSDEQRSFSDDIVVQFLTDLGYEINKSDTVKRRKPRSQPESNSVIIPDTSDVVQPSDTISNENVRNTADEEIAVDTMPTQTPSPHNEPADRLLDLAVMSAEISKLMGEDALKKIEALSEEDMILMLRSLSVQADFSDYRKNRLLLIKYLLLS